MARTCGYHPEDLPFSRESPHFACDVERHRTQLRSADEHLSSVTSCLSVLIASMQSVGSASRNLALVLEKTPSNFQAASVVGALASVLSELSSAEDVLAESLELSFHRPLVAFRKDLAKLDEIRRISDRADSEARSSVEMLLHGDWTKVEKDLAKRKNRRRQQQSPTSAKGEDDFSAAQTMYAAIDERSGVAAEKRRISELRRFDLSRFVSSLQRRKGLVLAETSVAALCSLRAFYAQASHAIGEAATAAHAQQTEIANACDRERRPWDLRMLKLQAVLNEPETRRRQEGEATSHRPPSPREEGDLWKMISEAEARHGVYAIDDHLDRLYHRAKNSYRLEGFLFVQQIRSGKNQQWSRRWFTLDDESLRVKREAPSWSGQLLRGVLAREPSSIDTQPFANDVDPPSPDYEEDDEVARLLLSTVKDCPDDRCCFEIHSAKGTPHRLQAAGEELATKWIEMLRQVIAAQLSRDSISSKDGDGDAAIVAQSPSSPSAGRLTPSTSSGGMLRAFSLESSSPKGVGIVGGPAGSSATTDTQRQQILADIEATNQACCDCGDENPEWCVINHGVLVCLRCSGVHRSLGTHVSKVRSLRLDKCSPLELSVTKRIGNDRANAIFEANLSLADAKKPTPHADAKTLASFIRAKWRDKAFVTPSDNPTQTLLEACTTSSLPQALDAIAHGADPAEPLFLCQAAEHACSEIAQFLVLNGASPENPHPLTHRLPLDYLRARSPDGDENDDETRFYDELRRLLISDD